MAEQPTPPTAPTTPPPLKGVSKQADEDMLEPGECILTVVHRSLIGLLGIFLVAIIAGYSHIRFAFSNFARYV